MKAILTKRKQVHEAQLQLAAIVESSDDAITGESLEGLITSWNRGAERIYGYIAEEVLGKPIVLLVPPEREDEVPALLEKLRRGERVEHYETVRRRKDGQRIHISLTLSPIKGAAGLVTGASAIARDITEHKRTQEQAHLLNRELETLIYVISHDLKEPLRAIESFSVMVKDHYAARLDEKGQDFLQRVIRAAARLRLLLDDILMLSRARRIAAPTDVIESKVVLQEALGLLQLVIEKTGAKITVAQDLPRVRGDKLWVTEAVYNLISNALKFTREGQVPQVEIGPYLPKEGDPAGVGIVVRDRGPGVAPEHAERIFQLFQRAVGREVEGTGAGLGIVRAVAEQHGGRAWVRLREGGGSEFIITFRAVEETRDEK